ncbi:unnamed protein product [Parnassius apollo]|uniref:(apollo) hypothetical protein n=1 Tax=Parnassius apollo TaxID=110799 RepID=A0A8S3XK15_PARAO|nr:unnamed protein product [Parnassius apollo]
MPFQYKPQGTTHRRKFTKRDLEQATSISEIQGGASIRKTAIKYEIDRTTLRRYHVCGEATLNKIEEKGGQYKSSQIFDNREKQLVKYLLIYSKIHYGLTRKQSMQLAFDYALANNKKIPQSWTNNDSAGKDWFRGFLARNPEISLRTPEATSL